MELNETNQLSVDADLSDRKEISFELPYVLFTLGESTYAIKSEITKSIEILGELTPITGTDENIRGGVNYRDKFIFLTDLRKLLGLNSKVEEFEKMVQPERRLKEHEGWMATLEKSVSDRVDFTLADDPHKCAFGKWYYNYKTEDNLLKHQLKSIEAPHEAMHNAAKKIKELMRKSEYEKAEKMVRDLRSTYYKTTTQILASLSEIFVSSIKELYIVIEHEDGFKGIIIDSITGVEYLGLLIDEKKHYSKYISYVGRRVKDNSVVFVLDEKLLFE